MQIKIITVVGARPNFMKAAPIVRAIGKHNAQAGRPEIIHLLVHTGQHYDEVMSEQFFVDLQLPKPDVFLGVGSSSHGAQTADMLKSLEEVLMRERPSAVIVVGDVNSTVAAALAAAKLPSGLNSGRTLVAHVESGLRSFDRSMPEEINRIVTDHLADILFVTEKSGLENLRREGIAPERIFFVGNTMIDTLLAFKDRADESPVLHHLGLCNLTTQDESRNSVLPYALLTLHRPSNVDEANALRNILQGVSELAQQLPIIFPAHPRTRKRIDQFGFGDYFHLDTSENRNTIHLVNPLGYLDFLCLMKNARLVLTDSGGIQEETTCLGVPCVTIRENTERPITVERGTNVTAGTSVAGIRQAIGQQMYRQGQASIPEKWDGRAAQRIVRILQSTLSGKCEGPGGRYPVVRSRSPEVSRTS